MRATTIDNKLKSAISLLKQNFTMAELCGWDIDLLISENKKAWSIIDKCPRYTKAYLKGVEDFLRDIVNNNKLEFCYVYNGQKYSTYKGSKHKPIEMLYNLNLTQDIWDKMRRGHFWITTDKLYY